MDPAHYAGLLRVDRTPRALAPPEYDPRYQHVGTVERRDLASSDELYEPSALYERSDEECVNAIAERA